MTKEELYPETQGEMEDSEEAIKKTDDEIKGINKPKKDKTKIQEMTEMPSQTEPTEEVTPIEEPELSKMDQEPDPTKMTPEPATSLDIKNIGVTPERAKSDIPLPTPSIMPKNKKDMAKLNQPANLMQQPIEQPKKKERAPVKQKAKKGKDLVSETLSNLIKVAENLDKEGKDFAAEEIHKIIRKYQERL